MTYDVHLAETFQRSIKALKKKYPHVKDDLFNQIRALEEDPAGGDPIPARNIPVMAGDSSTLRLAPPLFLEFIVAYSMAEQIACG